MMREERQQTWFARVASGGAALDIPRKTYFSRLPASDGRYCDKNYECDECKSSQHAKDHPQIRGWVGAIRRLILLILTEKYVISAVRRTRP